LSITLPRASASLFREFLSKIRRVEDVSSNDDWRQFCTCRTDAALAVSVAPGD
jgi:hypothetical protein